MKHDVTYSTDTVELLDVQSSKAFGFSKDAEEMIFGMFTKNIYSNPIGSVVREITSNCFDSHKEANVSDPVILKLTKENNQHYISFIDVGVGMSRERMTKIFAQYFNSTKRSDNNQIGGFGIGGKTPLAYTDSFFIITVFDKVKYTYCVRKGKSSPVLDLMERTKTSDRNGTAVKIPIKSGDLPTFEREINRQLYYFENVIFEGFSEDVENNYRIIEGKNFLYRGDNYDSSIHICLGRVAYPLDFNVLRDMDIEIDIPVAIKFNIGDINVTVSREAIDYTEETKKLIKKRLELVSAELVGMLRQQHKQLKTLQDYYRMNDNPHTLFLGKDTSINISAFCVNELFEKFVKYPALKVPSQAEVISDFYNISMLGRKNKKMDVWDRSLRDVETEQAYLLKDENEMSRKKNAYMKKISKVFFAVRKKEIEGEVKTKLLEKLCKGKEKPSKKVIKQFNALRKEVYELVEKKMKRYADVEIPVGFKIEKNSYDPNQELPITYNDGYSQRKARIKLAHLAGSKATLFYDTLHSGEIRWAMNVYDTFFSPQKDDKFSIGTSSSYYNYPIRFITVSKANLKYIHALPNSKPVSEFFKLVLRKHNMLLKTVEAHNFIQRYEEIDSLFLNSDLYKEVDKPFVNVVKKLDQYHQKYSKVKQAAWDGTFEDLLRRLKINPKTVSYNGNDLFEKIEEKAKKNLHMKFIQNVERFDYSREKQNWLNNKEENDAYVELLSLVYVK